MNLVLIGQRGCGKTTVGRRLAEALWMRFVEPVQPIDAGALARLAGGDDQVIEWADGAALSADRVGAFKAAGRSRFIWLQADAVALAGRRAGRGSAAAAATAGGIEQAPTAEGEGGCQSAGGNEDVYRATADVVLDTTHLSVEQAVQQIVRRI